VRDILLAVGLLLCCGSLAAAADDDDLKIPEVVYPALLKQAQSTEAFVPSGWILMSQVTGDLNRDGIPDVVLVLRENNPKNVLKNDSLGENPFDTNPRILAVAFGQAGGAGYALKLENHTLIVRRTSPTVDDPLDDDGVAIERGALRVRLHFFASAGSWTASSAVYRFRYQNDRFELIGYDSNVTERNTGKTTDVSINYATGKMSTSRGTIDSDKKNAIWTTLPRRAPLTIEQIGDGLEFEPKK
jgi:hypothetical protein